MKKFLLLLILIITIISSAYSFDDKKINKTLGNGKEGTEFWFSPTPKFESNIEDQAQLILSIISDMPATIIITAHNGLIRDTIFTRPYLLTTVFIPYYAFPYVKDWNQPEIPDSIYKSLGVHIISNSKISVSAQTTSGYDYSCDGFVVLPVDLLGNEYICTSYKTDSTFQIQYKDWFPTLCSITATLDSTHLTYIMSGDSSLQTAGGLRPGQSAKVLLNAGDVYLVSSKGIFGDLAGSKILADKPVSVVSGNMADDIPDGIGAGYSTEMEFPISLNGKIFPVPYFPQRKHPSLIRIFAEDTNTIVYKNDIPIDTIKLKPGSVGKAFYETRVTDFNDDSLQIAVYSTNKPSRLTYYCTSSIEDSNNIVGYRQLKSNPFWMSILPYENFLTNVAFSIPEKPWDGGTHYCELIYQTDINGNMPDDLQFGQMKNGKLVWEKLSVLFPVKDKIFPVKIGNNTFATKIINFSISGFSGIYRIRSNNPFMIYLMGSSDDYNAFYGMPGAIANCGFDSTFISTDTLAPIVNITQKCQGYQSETVIDMPDDSKSSNIYQIKIDTLNLTNFQLQIDYPIDPSRKVNLLLEVNDNKLPGYAALNFSDGYGNTSLQEYKYSPYFKFSSYAIYDTVSPEVRTVNHSLTLTNQTDNDIIFNNIYFQYTNSKYPIFKLTDSLKFPLLIPKNDSLHLNLTFFNRNSENNTDGLVFELNDSCPSRYFIPVGIFCPLAVDSTCNVTFSNDSLDFGNVLVNTSNKKQITIRNNSIYFITIVEPYIYNYFSSFGVDRGNNSFPIYIFPQDSIVFYVLFGSHDLGIFVDTVIVNIDKYDSINPKTYKYIKLKANVIEKTGDINDFSQSSDISLELIPSPSYSKSTLKLNLINSGYIDCDLIDLNGNTIQNIFAYKYFEAGDNEYFLDFGSITDGVYFLRVKIDGKYYTKKVSVLR